MSAAELLANAVLTEDNIKTESDNTMNNFSISSWEINDFYNKNPILAKPLKTICEQ